MAVMFVDGWVSCPATLEYCDATQVGCGGGARRLPKAGLSRQSVVMTVRKRGSQLLYNEQKLQVTASAATFGVFQNPCGAAGLEREGQPAACPLAAAHTSRS